MHELAAITVFLLAAITLKRARFAMLVLVASLFSVEIYHQLFDWVLFYEFRGLVYWVAFLVLWRHGRENQKQALVVAVTMVWYALLAIEDELYYLGFESFLIYNNFEAGTNAIILLHLYIAISANFKTVPVSITNTFNR